MKITENFLKKKDFFYTLAISLTVLISCITFLKGFHLGVQLWGHYYWYLDYSFGIFKRCLLGNFTLPLLNLFHDVEAQKRCINLLYAVSCAAFVCLLICFSLKILKSVAYPFKFVVFLSLILLLASPYFQTIAILIGYVDIYLDILALISLLLILQNFKLLGIALSLVGILLNEGLIIRYFPVLFLTLFLAKKNNKELFLYSFIIILSTIFMYFFIIKKAITPDFENYLLSIPPDIGLNKILVNWVFKQTFISELRGGYERICTNLRVLLPCVVIYFSLPSFLLTIISVFCLCKLYRFKKIEHKSFFVLVFLTIVSSFSPFFILPLAADFSRFLSASIFTSFLTLLILCFYIFSRFQYSYLSKFSQYFYFSIFLISISVYIVMPPLWLFYETGVAHFGLLPPQVYPIWSNKLASYFLYHYSKDKRTFYFGSFISDYYDVSCRLLTTKNVKRKNCNYILEKAGSCVYGPYISLENGDYTIYFQIENLENEKPSIITADVFNGRSIVRKLDISILNKEIIPLSFSVSEKEEKNFFKYEFRIFLKEGKIGVNSVILSTTDGTYYNHKDSSGNWSGWENLNLGATLNCPALVSTSDGSTHYAVRGTNNGVYYNRKDSSGNWSTWEHVQGGYTSDSPVLASTSDGVHLAIRGTDNGIYYNCRGSNGNWSGHAINEKYADSGSL